MRALRCNPTEVYIDEPIACLGLLPSTDGEPKMRGGVLLPGMTTEEGVARLGVGLDVTPVAVQHVLPPTDRGAGLHRCRVDLIFRRRRTVAAVG